MRCPAVAAAPPAKLSLQGPWGIPSLEQPVLPAGTGLHRHVGVHFQNHIPVLIQEEYPKGAHLVRNAAGLRDAWDDAHGSDDALDGGVIGRTDDLQWERNMVTSALCPHPPTKPSAGP